jgi:hypothetical protein
MMDHLHTSAIRALIAMQVGVLEHNDENLTVHKAIEGIEAADREWRKILKEIRKL